MVHPPIRREPVSARCGTTIVRVAVAQCSRAIHAAVVTVSRRVAAIVSVYVMRVAAMSGDPTPAPPRVVVEVRDGTTIVRSAAVRCGTMNARVAVAQCIRVKDADLTSDLRHAAAIGRRCGMVVVAFNGDRTLARNRDVAVRCGTIAARSAVARCNRDEVSRAGKVRRRTVGAAWDAVLA
jgi:hypothetical protein